MTRAKNLSTRCLSKDEFSEASPRSAIDCTSGALSEQITDLIKESLALNSRRAYASDIARYYAWGGHLPATPQFIAAYLAHHQDTHSIATLTRWLASLAKAHRTLSSPNPTQSELVRSVFRGIRRVRGSNQKQAKPLLRNDLFLILDAMGNGVKAARDRALLLIGFAGGFRRSELVGLNRTDVEAVKQGLILTVRRSKTDPAGFGRKIGIPYGRSRHCPVNALEHWLSTTEELDPIFRPVSRHGEVGNCRLSGEAVSEIIRSRIIQAGLDPLGFSGHSLRAGFVTSAAQAGVSAWKIRHQTGHASDQMVSRYIRDADMFRENAAGALL